MLSRAQRRAISRFAAQETAGNDEHHSMPHLRQTARLALRLAEAEGADPDVCWSAAMLHDIRKNAAGDHGALGAEAAAAFLRSIGLPTRFIDKVRDAIHFHNKDFCRCPKERAVLYDSDKLPLMSPKGFKERLIPYWEMRLGKKAGLEMAIKEYHFFFGRFHTKTGRKRVRMRRGRMELLIERLKSSSDL
ncbi:MAG: HD domain-containing protein [Candidatus Micrarchaeota archaeon]